jgi:hypothetical protein
MKRRKETGQLSIQEGCDFRQTAMNKIDISYKVNTTVK